jgi:hypothetical protein
LTKELGTNDSETKSVDSSDIQPSPVKSSHSTSTNDSPVKGKKRERGVVGSTTKIGRKRSTLSRTRISEDVIPEEEEDEEDEA